MLCSIALVLAAAAAASADASETAPDKGGSLKIVIYRVNDLPVYRGSADGVKFDPTVVIACVEASVAPESWESNGGDAEISPFEKYQSLVIAQTDANHERIAKLLATMRKSARRRDDREKARNPSFSSPTPMPMVTYGGQTMMSDPPRRAEGWAAPPSSYR